ncbi:hypothetical protein Tco_0695233 [Tanacetum coccineum]
MLLISGVQITTVLIGITNKSNFREEDGTSETVDAQDCLGSLVLEDVDSTILALLLDPTDLDAFGFLLYTLSSEDGMIAGGVIVVSLRGTSLVEAILVKGHLFPNIVNILLVVMILDEKPKENSPITSTYSPFNPFEWDFELPKTYEEYVALKSSQVPSFITSFISDE